MKKRCLTAFTVVVCVLLGLSACGNAKGNAEPVANAGGLEETSQESVSEAALLGDGVVHAGSVEELFAAVRPGAVVELAGGTYNLSDYMENSGEMPDGSYAVIDSAYDGYEAGIYSLEDFTLRSAPGETVEIVVEPRYANVLSFMDCRGIVLENIIFGHTPEQGSCDGAVLRFEDCEDITLNHVELYGCGTYGINADGVSGLTMSDSIIRDCSYGIVNLKNCADIRMKSCIMKENQGTPLLSLLQSFVRFDDCSFQDNMGTSFISIFSASAVRFEGCSFGKFESESLNVALRENSSYVVGEGCSFETPITKTIVRVNSAKALLDNIRPDTQIMLAPGHYDLSDTLAWYSLAGYENEYASIEKVYDGLELVIRDVHNLTIVAESGDAADTTLVVTPRYANVLGFEGCSSISLLDITMGHTDAGECAGNVLNFTECDRTVVAGMDLYGCGVYGIGTARCSDFTCIDSTIRDCSNGALFLEDEYYTQLFLNCLFTGSASLGYFGLSDTEDYYFEHCTFGEKESVGILYNEKVTHYNCTISEVTGYPDYEDYGGLYEDFEPEPIDLTRLSITAYDGGVLTDKYYYTAYESYIGEEGDIYLESDYGSRYLVFDEDQTGIYGDSDGNERIFRWEMDSQYSTKLYFDDGKEAAVSLYVDAGGALSDSEEGSIWLYMNNQGESIWFY